MRENLIGLAKPMSPQQRLITPLSQTRAPMESRSGDVLPNHFAHCSVLASVVNPHGARRVERRRRPLQGFGVVKSQGTFSAGATMIIAFSDDQTGKCYDVQRSAGPREADRFEPSTRH